MSPATAPVRSPATRATPARAARAVPGFTLLELLVAMAIFAVLGTAVVTLLGQGMTTFTAGTADTSMQDRLQASLPELREDLANVFVPDPLGVPPNPVVDPARLPAGAGGAQPPPPQPPAVRLRSGWFKPDGFPPEKAVWAYYVAFVRTNARESEDPILREAGTAGGGSTALKPYDPAALESGTTGNLLATGGLLEVAYVAIPENLDVPGVLTIYRMFRAPAGGPKTLLDPANIDSLAEIRAAGRPRVEGVLHFAVRFRNRFATSWDVATKGRVREGEAYAGDTWDSTRALDKDFALFQDASSLGDVGDDVYPDRARIELTLGEPTAFGFGRAETRLAAPIGPEEIRVPLLDPSFLVLPGPPERWIKVGAEWMLLAPEKVDLATGVVVVQRKAGRRAVPREHPSEEPVYHGAAITTDVSMVGKDAYVRRR